jgi:hypothetical protein
MSKSPPFGPPLDSSDLFDQVTKHYGSPRRVALPEAVPDTDQVAVFERFRQHLQGASVALFENVLPGNLDWFFRLRLAQVNRLEPPLPALSVVALSPDKDGPRLAGWFADRFRSGWPFAECIFVVEGGDQEPLSASLGLPVERPGTEWTPLRPRVPARQRIALQFQRIWGRCGSTTGFENQVESLVRAGFLTIRVFTDATLRRGATLTARLAEIIPENNGHAGAHIDCLAVPEGPPTPVRARDHDGYWATWLAATATCRVRDSAIAEAMQNADAVVANHLECVGPAITLAPRARLMLELRDDRVSATAEMMRRGGKSEADIRIVEAAVSRVQTAVLAIPDICGHVSATEFERLGPLSQRAAILLPRVYTDHRLENETSRFDVLVFGDEHPFNITSLRWFLEEVWRPHLSAAGILVAIAGRAGNHVRHAEDKSPLLHFLGFVEDLDAVRLECRLTVVPDRHGTGTAVKTLATLAAGHPLVCTSVGLRGLDPSVSRLLPAHDDPEEFAADVLGLLNDPDRLTARRLIVEHAQAAITRGPDHAALLGQVPRPTSWVRRERLAKWARLTANATLPAQTPYHFAIGTSFPMSGSAWDQQVLLDGWHGAEAWGRWTDGETATLRIALAAPTPALLTLELDLEPSLTGATLTVSAGDATLGSTRPMPGLNAWDIPPEVTRGKIQFVVTLSVNATVNPASSGNSSDNRILGIGVRSLRLGLADA